MWFRNSSGNEDPILTMSGVVVAIILVKVLLGGVSLTIGGSPVSFGTIDSGLVASLLTPTLGAYVTHRFGEMKYGLSTRDDDPGAPDAPKTEEKK